MAELPLPNAEEAVTDGVATAAAPVHLGAPDLRLGVTPRWLHWLAIGTALATLPLLFLGAEVATKKVGMVDPVWPTAPWYLLEHTDSWERGIGFLIEHSHRLAGWTVGFCVTVLLLGLWRCEPRRWVRWLGVAAFVAVGMQGLLGGGRVRLNALFGTDLALIHGCFGQIVFSLLVSLAICTSRRWSRSTAAVTEDSALRHWSLLLTGLLLVQLVLGAIVRHKGLAFAQRGHLLVAFAVVAAVTWLVKTVWERHAAERHMVGAMRFLAILLVLQLLLGVEAWMVKFATPFQVVEPGHWLINRDLVRSVHVLVGSLLLATSVALTLEAHRATVVRLLAPPGHLEEAA